MNAAKRPRFFYPLLSPVDLLKERRRRKKRKQVTISKYKIPLTVCQTASC
jgi:hypothetical protein